MYWSYCDIADFSPETLENVYQNLSPSRKEYIDRLRRPQDKTRSLAAEALVYRLLETHSGITGVVLHREENGAPRLTGCKLSVSISHSGTMVACAISEEPVGIDIEKLRPIRPELLRHVCVDEEKKYIQEAENREQMQQRFFQVWTSKEAYFKKEGTGITDLKSVNTMQLTRQLHLQDGYMVSIV